MKGKLIIILFSLYGAIIAVAYHFHSIAVHESGLFLFNYVVEHYFIPPILLYYANEVKDPILGNELLALRIVLSVTFWGGISSILYVVWKTKKLLTTVETK